MLGAAHRRRLDELATGLTIGELLTDFGDVPDTAPAGARVETEADGHVGRRQQGELLGKVVLGHAPNGAEGV